MSIHAPAADWFKAPHGEEKIWVGIALLWFWFKPRPTA